MVKYLTKHRDEREQYRINFRMDLGKNERLTSIEEVRVLSWGKDVSDEFLDPTPPAFGETTVILWLRKAGEGEQAKGEYRLYVRARTNGGRDIVAQGYDRELPPLFVAE